jgi:hypothetical protein
VPGDGGSDHGYVGGWGSHSRARGGGIVENASRRAAVIRNARSRSCKETVLTATASSSPPRSTATCRFRLLIFFPAVVPAAGGRERVGGADGRESITAAVGTGPRPSARRARSALCRRPRPSPPAEQGLEGLVRWEVGRQGPAKRSRR